MPRMGFFLRKNASKAANSISSRTLLHPAFRLWAMAGSLSARCMKVSPYRVGWTLSPPVMTRPAAISAYSSASGVLPSITGMPPAAAMAFIYVPLTERTGTPMGLKRMPGVTKINFFILIRLNFFPGAENTPHCAQRRPGPGAP